jgi:hypothetical protein
VTGVSQHYAFTDNVRDLSNNDGYQFEFYCERCGNGYRSPFVRDKAEIAQNVLRTVGNFFGGNAYRLGSLADYWDRGTNSAAKDKAMNEAVETVREEFRQCRGCGDWVCHQVCWNEQVGQCARCSPFVHEELSRAQAQAQIQQMQEQTRSVDWNQNLDVSTRTTVTCPHCSAKVDGGKFCSSCGQVFQQRQACPNCESTRNAPGAAFCSDCGTSMRS